MTAAEASGQRAAVDAAAAAIMLGLTFCWGLNQVAIKVGTAGFSPVFLMFARSALGAALVFGWCSLRRIPLFERDGSLSVGLLVGFLFGAEFTLIFFGLDYTSAARAGMMINTMPFWVLVGAHFLLGERMLPRHLLGLALAFGGVALVFSDRLSSAGPAALWGDALCLAAGAAWGVTNLIIKRSRLVFVSAEKLLLYQLAASAAMALALLPISGSAFREVSALTVGSLLFQAVLITAVTYLIWFWLMRRYPAAGLASFTFLTPVFAVLCGAALLGEPLTGRIFAALALIAAGLIVVNRPVRRTIP